MDAPLQLGASRRAEVLDGFLEVLGCAERDLLARLDLNGLAGRGIAAHASSTLANLQNAQPDNPDPIPLLQMLGQQADEIAQNGLGLFLRHRMVIGKFRCEMLQSDGRRRCPLGCMLDGLPSLEMSVLPNARTS